MRTASASALLFASMAVLAGCAPTVGNSLDWQEKSVRKVTANVPRYGDDRLAFATKTTETGLADEGVVQQFAIEFRGFPEQATVSLRCLRDFRAAVWFRGFEADKLKDIKASLVDNRGHEFKLSRVRPSYGCAAELAVDRRQNADWMEFNNRSYFMTLTVEFTYDGKPMKAHFPKILCVFDKYSGS